MQEVEWQPEFQEFLAQWAITAQLDDSQRLEKWQLIPDRLSNLARGLCIATQIEICFVIRPPIPGMVRSLPELDSMLSWFGQLIRSQIAKNISCDPPGNIDSLEWAAEPIDQWPVDSCWRVLEMASELLFAASASPILDMARFPGCSNPELTVSSANLVATYGLVHLNAATRAWKEGDWERVAAHLVNGYGTLSDAEVMINQNIGEFRKRFAESKIRRAGAMKRHEENHNMRVDVETWFAANRHRFKSVDAAAIEASTLIAPVTFRTAQSWIANWKRSVQSASKP